MQDGKESNLIFQKFEPIPKSESKEKEESKLTMKNVEEVFYEAGRASNPDDEERWADNLISHQRFYQKNIDKCKPRIAKLLIQLQPRFFNSPGFNYTSAINNELQERWDTSGDNSKGKGKGKESKGVYALKLLALAKAAKLGDVTTSRTETNYKSSTPILFLINREECNKIISEDDKKKSLESQNK